jgi:hypothetical protein
MNKVYVKSNLGVREFEAGNRSLSLKHRQLLIMVNGLRTDGDISRMYNSDSAVQMLLDLEKLGYVMPAGAAQKPFENRIQASPVEYALSHEHLAFIKTFLIEEAQLQLGLMSRDIEQKVTLVQNSDDLQSCIARWHMAIRDSRNGRTVADRLMERLAHLMANPPQAAASDKAS